MSSGEHRIDRDELLARTDLADVLDALTTGTGEGHRRRWNCPDPDHRDVHPSVSVHTTSRGTQRWRCWSGGHGGTAIDAVAAAHRIDVGDAIRWINDHLAHIGSLDRQPPAPGRPIGQPAPEVIRYVERCAKLLWTPAGRGVREWLNARGYSDEILEINKVGADPGRRYLPRPKGFPAGWPAAVYPALDRDGDVAYFQARYLDPPTRRGKYDNPSRQWATNPRLGWVRPLRRQGDIDPWLIVTEGIADALAAAHLGHHAVGILGTCALDTTAVARIRRVWSKRLAVCFDADDAGKAGQRRVVEHLNAVGFDDVALLHPPLGMDLTDWLFEDPAAIRTCLDAMRAEPLARERSDAAGLPGL